MGPKRKMGPRLHSAKISDWEWRALRGTAIREDPWLGSDRRRARIEAYTGNLVGSSSLYSQQVPSLYQPPAHQQQFEERVFSSSTGMENHIQTSDQFPALHDGRQALPNQQATIMGPAGTGDVERMLNNQPLENNGMPLGVCAPRNLPELPSPQIESMMKSWHIRSNNDYTCDLGLEYDTLDVSDYNASAGFDMTIREPAGMGHQLNPFQSTSLEINPANINSISTMPTTSNPLNKNEDTNNAIGSDIPNRHVGETFRLLGSSPHASDDSFEDMLTRFFGENM